MDNIEKEIVKIKNGIRLRWWTMLNYVQIYFVNLIIYFFGYLGLTASFKFAKWFLQENARQNTFLGNWLNYADIFLAILFLILAVYHSLMDTYFEFKKKWAQIDPL